MIYFLRHGEDDEGFVGGWSDAELTEKGIAQVREVIPILRKLPIEKIISSDIKRARMTAQIVSDALNIPVFYSPKLRELDKGLLTGMSKVQAEQIYPWFQQGLEVHQKYPEGESMLDLYNRIKELKEEMSSWDKTLVITHRGVINMIYFLTQNRLPDTDKKQFQVTHASIHVWDPKRNVIERLGE